MLTTSQIKWASQHDWFLRDNGDGTIEVRDGFTVAGLYAEHITRWAWSFRALREWAGY